MRIKRARQQLRWVRRIRKGFILRRGKLVPVPGLKVNFNRRQFVARRTIKRFIAQH